MRLEITSHHSFVKRSSNVKIGPIPATMSSRSTCSDLCPFKRSGCFGDNFPLSLHWDRLDRSGLSWEEMIGKIQALQPLTLFRHNVVGDLHLLEDGSIDKVKLEQFAAAAEHKKPIIYTHSPKTTRNLNALSKLRESRGLVVNVSCETFAQAERALSLGVNAVLTVKRSEIPVTARKSKTLTFVPCPAESKDDVTCATCKLCARDRVASGVVVTFHAHGAQTKKLETALDGVEDRV